MTYSIPKPPCQSIFRAYDIRGIAREDQLSLNMAYAIGRAFASEASLAGELAIIIGRDGRLSSPQLSEALSAGLCDSGCDVIDLGLVPTPLVYFATYTLTSKTGIMLTGSHNPGDYNGMKMVMAGKTLSGDTIQSLYQRINDEDFLQGQGSYSQRDIKADYIKRVCQDVKLKKPLKIVIDCGNGVPGVIAPELFKALGCDVIEMYCDVDGTFPNHHPDPSQLENIQELMDRVIAEKAHVGLAFDGDGDRLGVITNEGENIWPDRQMMLYAKDILSRVPGEQIIFDVKCTSKLADVIEAEGGRPLMWKTGHSLVKAKIQETGAPLAGEMSGHIFFKERWYGFDDALYTGARLLEIVAKDARDIASIFNDFPDSVNTPELKLPLDEAIKFTFMDLIKQKADFGDAHIIDIDGVRVEFPEGWGLIRPSNTTPCLVMRFEADNEKALLQIQDIFRRELLKLDSELVLPF